MIATGEDASATSSVTPFATSEDARATIKDKSPKTVRVIVSSFTFHSMESDLVRSNSRIENH